MQQQRAFIEVIVVIGLAIVLGASLYLLKTESTIQTNNSPTNIPTASPYAPRGYYFQNPDEEAFKYTLNLPDDCTEEWDDLQPHFDYKITVTCKTSAFELLIFPQAVQRGERPLDLVMLDDGVISNELITWTYEIFQVNDQTSGHYQGILQENEYFNIDVIFYPHSKEAQTYFENILSTFSLLQ